MPDVEVNTYYLKQYAQRLSTVNSRISRLDSRLNSLYFRTGLLDLFNLIQADLLTGFSWRLSRCQSYLNQTAKDFENIERYLLQFDPVDFHPPRSPVVWQDYIEPENDAKGSHMPNLQEIFQDGTVGAATLPVLGSVWEAFWDGKLEVSEERSVCSKTLTSEGEETYAKVLTGKHTTYAKPDYGTYKDREALGVNIEQTKKSFKKVNPEEAWYRDPKATILEGKVGKKIEGSVRDAKISGSNDWAEGSVESKILTGEAHANAAAGLYVYTKGKDGEIKKVFSPGVSAEVGGSVAVVQVEAEGRIGLGEDKNMLGLYGNVDAKALTAESKAKLAVNRNEIYAGVSAEADLAKISAAGGVAVLGTEVGVSGSLKVGIGAHAEVGYTDGKFKVDIGAAVGVGFDLGLEVDIGGTVDAVCDVASSAWDNATDAISDTLSWLRR